MYRDYSFSYKKLDYDNEMHPYRFLLVFCLGLLLSCLFPLINREGWVFLCIGLALLVFSNTIISLYSISGFIFLSLLLCKDPDIITYYVYFTAVLIATVLFQDIEKDFKVVPAIAISNLVLFILETAGFVILKNEECYVYVYELGSYSVGLRIRCWTSFKDYWPFYNALSEKVLLAFRENGIRIPSSTDIQVQNRETQR